MSTSFPDINVETWPEPHQLKDDEYHCFISHCSEDEEVVQFLDEVLQGRGFKCFCSARDFRVGELIIENIRNGVLKSDKMILLVSRHMKTSDWVEYEVAEARAKERKSESVVLIPVLYDVTDDDVPTYLKDAGPLDNKDPNFWTKLLKALTAQIGLTDLLPVGNVYQGISWSFYYGYISLILPGLAEQIRAFGHEMADVHKCDKLLMALPESCRIPNEMKDVDKNFITVGNVEQIGVVAGKPRSYKVPLYQIKDEKNGKEYLLSLVFPTAMSLLHKIEENSAMKFYPCDRKRQMILFKQKMEEIVNSEWNTNCKDRAVIICYNDTPGCDKTLSDLVLDKLREDPSVLTM